MIVLLHTLNEHPADHAADLFVVQRHPAFIQQLLGDLSGHDLALHLQISTPQQERIRSNLTRVRSSWLCRSLCGRLTHWLTHWRAFRSRRWPLWWRCCLSSRGWRTLATYQGWSWPFCGGWSRLTTRWRHIADLTLRGPRGVLDGGVRCLPSLARSEER